MRAWKAVGAEPLFIARAGKDRHIFDADGRKYIDFVGSWGPAILAMPIQGSSSSVKAAAGSKTFGAPTENEVRLAEMVCDLLPSIE